MRRYIAFGWAISLLVLLSAACETGEILTPAEATARARQTAGPQVTPVTAEEAEFQINQTVVFTSSGFLVPLRQEPGEGTPFSYAGRGEEATILASKQVEGETWYRVRSKAGSGWVPSKFLAAAEAGSTESAQPPEVAEGPQVGDTVYLTGRGFLINLLSQPGGNRIVANQERGAAVVIEQIALVEGKLWYQVDAPTGLGWVPAENISPQQP